MLDYQKLRETAKAIVGVSWVTSKPCAFHEFMELLDKAEKWDKVNEGLAVDGIHTSPGLLKELFELREKAKERDKAVERVEVLENIIEKIHAMASKESPFLYQKIIDISANAIEDPAPVEEGKR